MINKPPKIAKGTPRQANTPVALNITPTINNTNPKIRATTRPVRFRIPASKFHNHRNGARRISNL